MLQKFKNQKKEKTEKKISSYAVGMLLVLVAVTALVFAVYRFFLQTPYFVTVLVIYMVLCAVSVLSYVIYNRGFSRKGITADMLPDSWSEEQKTEFVEDGERRRKKSRWMLIPMFAFIFTFAVDMIELWVLPTLQKLFFS